MLKIWKGRGWLNSLCLEPSSPFRLVPMEPLYATDTALNSKSESFNTGTMFTLDPYPLLIFIFWTHINTFLNYWNCKKNCSVNYRISTKDQRYISSENAFKDASAMIGIKKTLTIWNFGLSGKKINFWGASKVSMMNILILCISWKPFFVLDKNPALWPNRIFVEIVLLQPLASLRTPNPWKDLSTYLKILVIQMMFISS